MPSSWGKTYITLIPKKSNPKLVFDFHPISLCNVSYKVISKILANRLKVVLPRLISKDQCGFVEGRTPFDNIITLQEVVHSINADSLHSPRMMVKIDIEKAYDTLSWNAILAILYKMNLPSSWINWIHACISSASFSFIINKKPIDWIKSSHGLRQGDPISSYLFILVSQNLTAILNFAMRNNMIPGFNSSLHYNFNYLMYDADLIVITQAS